jgi:hypothetical protein
MIYSLKKVASRVLTARQKKIVKKFARKLFGAKQTRRLAEILSRQLSTMRYFDNIRDLDLELKKVDEAFCISDDAGRRALAQFCYVVTENLPDDPYSAEYYAAQMCRYYTISGRESYSAKENEHTEFDFEQTKNNQIGRAHV